MVRASLASQLAYRSSFLLEAFGKLAVLGLELVGVIVLFGYVHDLAGWTRWEVIYLYGVGSIALGAAELLTDGLNEMPELVRTGAFDGVLLRPAPSLVQVLGRQCRPLHLGRMAQGVAALVAALVALDRELGPLALAMLPVNLLAPMLVYGGIFVIEGATCIFTVQSSEAFNAFTYGGVQMTQYPVPIYRKWLQHVFLWVVPVGLATYFPALAVLGKPDGLGLPAWLPFAAPVVAALFLAAALRYWAFAVDRYRSTGS
jgi:ABC-2 type transport system permease protein